MTNTPTSTQSVKLTHIGYALNVLFRGWQNISGVQLRTSPGINQNGTKKGKKQANKASFYAGIHKCNLQLSRLLRAKMDYVCLITSIMLSRIDYLPIQSLKFALFNIINPFILRLKESACISL